MKTTHLGLMAAVLIAPLAGCHHDHHDDHHEVDAGDTVIVDENHYEHHGHYDASHAWHGGYYDEHHEYHDDPPDWRHG